MSHPTHHTPSHHTPAHHVPAHPVGARSARAATAAVHGCGHLDARVCREVVAEIRALHGALARRTDLAPGPETNALFGRLVALAVDPAAARAADAVLADPAVEALLPELRRLCSDGEFELERSWARQVVAAPDPAAELARFPYHGNYVDLTHLEHHALVGVAPPPRRVLFVGSGPLPLTSLLLAEHYGCRVDNLDRVPEAVTLGRRISDRLDVPGLGFAVGDVADHDDLAGYDLVYLAALAGLDPEGKRRLLAHLARRLDPGTLVLARSAHALRGLLYPVLDPYDLPGLVTVAVVHPFTDVVNSVVLARVGG